MNKKSILKAIFYMPLILYIKNSQMLYSAEVVGTALSEGVSDLVRDAAGQAVDGGSAAEEAAAEEAAAEEAAARKAGGIRLVTANDVAADDARVRTAADTEDGTAAPRRVLISLSADSSGTVTSKSSLLDIDCFANVLNDSLKKYFFDIDSNERGKISSNIIEALKKLLTEVDNPALEAKDIIKGSFFEIMFKKLVHEDGTIDKEFFGRASQALTDIINRYNEGLRGGQRIDLVEMTQALKKIESVLLSSGSATTKIYELQDSVTSDFTGSTDKQGKRFKFKARSISAAIALGIVVIVCVYFMSSPKSALKSIGIKIN